MGGDNHAAPTGPPNGDGQHESLHRKLMRAFVLLTPWGLNRRISNVESRIGTRVAVLESRLDGVEAAIRTLQDELAAARDERLAPLERRADAVEHGLQTVTEETARVRDLVVPAAVARGDALIDRLAEELEETASLVERLLRAEPLPTVAASTVDEGRLAASLAEVQPRILESFRGSEEEIAHRLDRYLADLRGAAPVLDLGCGRGELLLLLREAGVAASGVETDPALIEGARRRGLEVEEGDVLDVLRGRGDGTCGAVTAIHLLEHLAPTSLAAVLAEARRVLRPGGVLIAECPNPHSLRVGAALYWQDPTHQRPLLPETLELFLRSAGFRVLKKELLHAFPEEQLLTDDEGGTGAVTDADLTILAERVDRLRRRLDELLNGPRDFAIWAEKPTT